MADGSPAVDPDRDGFLLAPGDTRYIRHEGRLLRGRVYPYLSNRWTFWVGERWVTTEHASAYFTVTNPRGEPRRYFPDQPARVERVLREAVASRQWGRVATLSGALQRLRPRAEVDVYRPPQLRFPWSKSA